MEHSDWKRQDYLFRWSVAPVDFSPERHEKQCPIHFSTGFSLTFCKWQKTLTSETEWDGKKKFWIIEWKFAVSSSAEISFLAPWFPGFTRTNEVLYVQAGFGLVSLAAVFSIVVCGEERCVTILKTAARETSFGQTGSKAVNKKCIHQWRWS